MYIYTIYIYIFFFLHPYVGTFERHQTALPLAPATLLSGSDRWMAFGIAGAPTPAMRGFPGLDKSHSHSYGPVLVIIH